MRQSQPSASKAAEEWSNAGWGDDSDDWGSPEKAPSVAEQQQQQKSVPVKPTQQKPVPDQRQKLQQVQKSSAQESSKAKGSSESKKSSSKASSGKIMATWQDSPLLKQEQQQKQQKKQQASSPDPVRQASSSNHNSDQQQGRDQAAVVVKEDGKCICCTQLAIELQAAQQECQALREECDRCVCVSYLVGKDLAHCSTPIHLSVHSSLCTTKLPFNHRLRQQQAPWGSFEDDPCVGEALRCQLERLLADKASLAEENHR